MTDGAASSLSVHIQSLVDFAQRLREHVDGIQRPVQAVAEINAQPELPLGSFAEAFSFSDDHADCAAEMVDVLATLSRAAEFAATATRIVADRYEALDSGGARNVAAAVGLGGPTATGTAAAPPGSLAPPDPRLVEFLLPAQGGTIYYRDPSSDQPAVITVESRPAAEIV